MINLNLKRSLDGLTLATEASRLQIGAANCNQRGGGGGGGGGGGAAQNNVSPLAEAKKTCTHHQFGHASSTNLTDFSSIPCYENFSQI